MTKEERHLWYDFLKGLPVTIHRQKVIGNYIVDFYCASSNLVIEIDGSQHYDQEGITVCWTNTTRESTVKVLTTGNLKNFSNLNRKFYKVLFSVWAMKFSIFMRINCI